ncbi:acyloxyacyl hydrolase [Parvicella tangerina]|uniref:Acyloxyacyl hydrolase n=1 Tax=Parvicella tangerina TaxID=2829795 RepID=A0A916NF96_9FLAO|nr:acyloxyacyl hydrolase [Parvicella tangerina]CAG5077284.1 hypothetical protein CRYO30217_00339 [Parvicella tangerina]
MARSWLILVLFFGFSAGFFGQQKFTDNLKVSANIQYGWSLPEYSFISYFTDSYISSLEVNLLKETTGKKYWEKLYNYPEVGLSAFYTTLGNDSLFGRAFALNYFFKLKLVDRKRFSFFNRTGIGLGYLTEHFDLNTNKSNVAIGSHINIHFSFKWGLNYKLSDQLVLNGGLSFDHFSNGNTADPNRGLNNFTGYLGASYYIGERTERLNPSLDSLERHNYVEIFGNIGGKQPRSLSSGYFVTSSLSLSVVRATFRAVHFGLGTDIFYDSSIEGVLNDLGQEYKPSYDFQTGVFLTQQFIYNRIRIGLVEGIYVLLDNKVYNKPVYTKAFIQYQIHPHISVRLTMKSHLHILDYPELGIGYKF